MLRFTGYSGCFVMSSLYNIAGHVTGTCTVHSIFLFSSLDAEKLRPPIWDGVYVCLCVTKWDSQYNFLNRGSIESQYSLLEVPEKRKGKYLCIDLCRGEGK